MGCHQCVLMSVDQMSFTTKPMIYQAIMDPVQMVQLCCESESTEAYIMNSTTVKNPFRVEKLGTVT